MIKIMFIGRPIKNQRSLNSSKRHEKMLVAWLLYEDHINCFKKLIYLPSLISNRIQLCSILLLKYQDVRLSKPHQSFSVSLFPFSISKRFIIFAYMAVSEKIFFAYTLAHGLHALTCQLLAHPPSHCAIDRNGQYQINSRVGASISKTEYIVVLYVYFTLLVRTLELVASSPSPLQQTQYFYYH